MKKKLVHHITVFGGLLLSLAVTSVLFQNCSQSQFSSPSEEGLISERMYSESSTSADSEGYGQVLAKVVI